MLLIRLTVIKLMALLVAAVSASPDITAGFFTVSSPTTSTTKKYPVPIQHVSESTNLFRPQLERAFYHQPDTEVSALFASTGSRSTGNSILKDLPLNRPHERVVFTFYSCVGATLIYLWTRGILNQVQVESGLSILWAGMVLAISFLEAWVKFKAPFLRKHVAVDVGRHVFCALNTVELAISTSLWTGRFLVAPPPAVRLVVLPAVATALLWLEIIVVAPKLYARAKHKIVEQASVDHDLLNEHERMALSSLADAIRNEPLPPGKWHFVYVLMEAVKVACLTGFVFWMRAN
jgi:hypothetical protein